MGRKVKPVNSYLPKVNPYKMTICCPKCKENISTIWGHFGLDCNWKEQQKEEKIYGN